MPECARDRVAGDAPILFPANFGDDNQSEGVGPPRLCRPLTQYLLDIATSRSKRTAKAALSCMRQSGLFLISFLILSPLPPEFTEPFCLKKRRCHPSGQRQTRMLGTAARSDLPCDTTLHGFHIFHALGEFSLGRFQHRQPTQRPGPRRRISPSYSVHVRATIRHCGTLTNRQARPTGQLGTHVVLWPSGPVVLRFCCRVPLWFCGPAVAATASAHLSMRILPILHPTVSCESKHGALFSPSPLPFSQLLGNSQHLTSLYSVLRGSFLFVVTCMHAVR